MSASCSIRCIHCLHVVSVDVLAGFARTDFEFSRAGPTLMASDMPATGGGPDVQREQWKQVREHIHREHWHQSRLRLQPHATAAAVVQQMLLYSSGCWSVDSRMLLFHAEPMILTMCQHCILLAAAGAYNPSVQQQQPWMQACLRQAGMVQETP
jgi:hypothetical protein